MKEFVKQLSAPLRVLHLEDNSWDAELIKEELESRDFPCTITQVSTEGEFEAALENGGFDVILSDSNLPGYETLKALTRSQEVWPEVPFIFVSGTASPSARNNAFSAGALDFIQKDELPKLVLLLNRLIGENNFCQKPGTPEANVPVVVQCEGFRCLAYLDKNGKWRDFVRSEELPGVSNWFEL